MGTHGSALPCLHLLQGQLRLSVILLSPQSLQHSFRKLIHYVTASIFVFLMQNEGIKASGFTIWQLCREMDCITEQPFPSSASTILWKSNCFYCEKLSGEEHLFLWLCHALWPHTSAAIATCPAGRTSDWDIYSDMQIAISEPSMAVALPLQLAAQLTLYSAAFANTDVRFAEFCSIL